MSKQVKRIILVGAAAVAVFWQGQAMAQSPLTGPAAQAKLATQDANEKLAWAYYKPGNTFEQRMAYISPAFVNHSQEVVRFMALNHIATAKEAFRAIVETRAKLAGDPSIGTNQASSQPWNVMASGELVTVVHERQLPDPTRPGQTYAFYQFDLFRVQDGKFVEHWDGAQVPQPLPAFLAQPVSQLKFPDQAR